MYHDSPSGTPVLRGREVTTRRAKWNSAVRNCMVSLSLRPRPFGIKEGCSPGRLTPKSYAQPRIDPCSFVQDSLSRSAKGVVRGLHLRSGEGEAKIVRCSSGAIFDVVVDLRPDSPTFRRWASFELTGDAQTSVYIPAGCAHGFQALTDPADTTYRIDRAHDPSEDVAILWDDPELAIPWPLPMTSMSDRDLAAPPLAEVLSKLGA